MLAVVHQLKLTGTAQPEDSWVACIFSNMTLETGKLARFADGSTVAQVKRPRDLFSGSRVLFQWCRARGALHSVLLLLIADWRNVSDGHGCWSHAEREIVVPSSSCESLHFWFSPPHLTQDTETISSCCEAQLH